MGWDDCKRRSRKKTGGTHGEREEGEEGIRFGCHHDLTALLRKKRTGWQWMHPSLIEPFQFLRSDGWQRNEKTTCWLSGPVVVVLCHFGCESSTTPALLGTSIHVQDYSVQPVVSQ